MSGEIYGKKHDSLLSKNLQRYVKHGVCCGHVQAYVAYVYVFVTSIYEFYRNGCLAEPNTQKRQHVSSVTQESLTMA